ncbi:MAG: DUF6106 family protein [Dorea sp.]
MNDFYTEQLVKKQAGKKDFFVKVILIMAAVACVVLAPVIPLGWVVAALVIVAVVLLFRRMDIEYEYMFINGDLDIDVIYRKTKRKKILSVNVSDLVILAPVGSIELKQYQKAKTFDYSSGTGNKKLYGLVVGRQGQLAQIIFEPNETIVDGFFYLAPRKVIRN